MTALGFNLWLNSFSFRLLTEYYSFLCTREVIYMIKKVKSFRLLTEYYSFLLEQKTEFIYTVELPIVSVSLRSIIHSYTLITFNVFSCLYSFRLLTEYYSFLLEKNLKGCKDSFKFRVSVSLRSIIHSYKSKYVMIHLIKNESFRLLTEYYSFLLKTCNY